jgi:hypothetical protein
MYGFVQQSHLIQRCICWFNFGSSEEIVKKFFVDIYTGDKKAWGTIKQKCPTN